MNDHEPADRRCAWCGELSSAPIESLPVVHGCDGDVLSTCSEICLANLVGDLAGRPSPTRRDAEVRRG